MFKKLLSFILICIISIPLVACGGNDESTSKVESKDSEEELTLTDKDISNIKENLDTFTKETAFEGATFEIELNKKDLKISVIKPITDIMTSYKTTTADDTVEAIKKSLVFNDAYDAIVEETGLKVDCMQVFIYNGDDEFKNNDYYTLKTIM